MTSPTVLTLDRLRINGAITADVVERFLAFSGKGRGPGVRKDWGGFADIAAVAPNTLGRYRLVLVQCTTRSNLAGRKRKILGLAPASKGYDPVAVASAALGALLVGAAVEAWGWFQPTGKGGRWNVETVSFAVEDFLAREEVRVRLPYRESSSPPQAGELWYVDPECFAGIDPNQWDRELPVQIEEVDEEAHFAVVRGVLQSNR